MYDPLAHYYEEIFPVSEKQIQFVLTSLRNASAASPKRHDGGGTTAAGVPLRLLDVGCAVGDLAAAVAHAGRSPGGDAEGAVSAPGIEVDAIDLNSAMIQRAAARHSEKVHTGRLRFHRMDMLRIADEFEPESFDAIACMGNTLVHQPGPLEIEQFFKAAAHILRTRGSLILQLLNYDYLLAERPKKLPLIDSEQVLFEQIGRAHV